MSTAQKLLESIEAFLSATGMSPTTFGKLAINDGHLVRDLRAGKPVMSTTIDRVHDFMRSYRPGNRPLGRRQRQGSHVAA